MGGCEKSLKRLKFYKFTESLFQACRDNKLSLNLREKEVWNEKGFSCNVSAIVTL